MAQGSPGVSQVEQGEHRRSFVRRIVYEHMSLREVRCCCTAAVGLSVYLRGELLKFRRSVDRNRSGCVRDGAHAQTRTHRSTVRGCHEGNALEVRLPLCHGCHNV